MIFSDDFLDRICREILNEGISYQFDDDLDSYDDVELIRHNGKLLFRTADYPNDFIRIQPVFSSESLPIKAADPKSLSSFDAEILYGFEAVEASEFFDSNASLNDQVSEIRSMYDEIIDTSFRHKPNKAPKTIDDFNVYISDISLQINRLRRSGQEVDYLKEALSYANNIKNLLIQYKSAYTTTIDGLFKQLNKNKNQSKNSSNAYINKLVMAFAKAVKGPKSPDERLVRNKFIRLSADLFIKHIPEVFDIILIPQSSQSFNKLFAAVLSENRKPMYGVHEITKRTVGELEFNRTELIRIAGRIDRRVDAELGRVPTPEEWADREINKLQSRLPNDPNVVPQIHNFSSGDKRRYVKMYKMDHKIADYVIGAKVLIVDDNVAHQGTIELLYDLLKEESLPESVTIFTPLLLPTKL